MSVPEGLLDESAEDLFESAPCGYLTTALDGTILRVNRTFEELTGRARSDLVGAMRFADLGAETVLPDGIETERVLLRTATVGGTAVGWIWVTLPGPPGRPELAWIHHLGVDPEHQGHGYARTMIEAIQVELAGYRVDRLGLNVFGDNLAAIRLYESLGFRVTAQQMAKSLRPPGQRPADPG